LPVEVFKTSYGWECFVVMSQKMQCHTSLLLSIPSWIMARKQRRQFM
jgi:hypothetical protein